MWEVEILRRPKRASGFPARPQRWGVERTSAGLGKDWRLSKDYEALPEASEARIHATMIPGMARRPARIRGINPNSPISSSIGIMRGPSTRPLSVGFIPRTEARRGKIRAGARRLRGGLSGGGALLASAADGGQGKGVMDDRTACRRDAPPSSRAWRMPPFHQLSEGTGACGSAPHAGHGSKAGGSSPEVGARFQTSQTSGSSTATTNALTRPSRERRALLAKLLPDGAPHPPRAVASPVSPPGKAFFVWKPLHPSAFRGRLLISTTRARGTTR
jgi:hypothetical protein